MLLQFAIDETSEAYLTSTAEERREAVADIERAFDENVNYPDYARKLHLIENCIYGVDIQPIAIQISKLRFFISLVIDQKRMIIRLITLAFDRSLTWKLSLLLQIRFSVWKRRRQLFLTPKK